jgi:predicted DNA-binding transcriptional regulator AlpA
MSGAVGAAPLTVDTEGAATQIGLAVSTLEKLRVSGGGPRFVKLGRAVRYRMTDLEAYLAERVVESTSQRAVA